MKDSISQHIAILLRRHDCVIVPGVGAFVATRREAMIADGLMTPPSRIISFNSALTHDDGLLAGSVSRRLKISFEQSRERVAAEAALLQRRLKAEGAVHLNRVGTLQRRGSSRLEFSPDQAWTLALPAVKLPAPKPTFEVVRPIEEAESRSKRVAVVRVPLRVQWMRTAVAAAVLCVLGFALSTPIDVTTAQRASLAAPAFTAPEPAVVEMLPEPDGLELNLAMAPRGGAFVAQRPQDAVPQNFVVVVASLPSRAKALEFIGETGLSTLEIMQSGENYRVYAASGATADEALSRARATDGFTSRFPDAWVCRR